MAYKIYTKSNYFYIVDTTNDKIFEGLAKDVRVRKEFVDSTDFIFENVNGFSTQQSIPFASIQDENSVAYTDVATFVAFYEANTGNFNQGGATPLKQFYGLITQSGTDNPVVTEVINTLGYSVSFIRTGIGNYETTNVFNPDETTYGFQPRNQDSRGATFSIDDDLLDNTGKIQFYSNINADDYLYRTPFWITIK